ncbi:MAG: hypothetical protein ABEJ79_01675 [Halolamina sp.]
MHPEEAARQMADIIDANLDESGYRHAPMYGREFERVAAEGSTEDVSELAHRLGAAVRAGSRPSPSEVAATADRVLDRPLTDGGG